MKAEACLALVAFSLSGCTYSAQKRAAGWTVVDTQHVRLRTTLPSEDAVELAREMQRIRDGLANSVFRCAFRGSDRFAVTVLPRRQFNEIRPRQTIGFYRRWSITWLPDYEGQIVLPDDLRAGRKQVFQHELAHHLVHTCIARPPVWLNEGLAGLLETAEMGDGTVKIGRQPYLLTPGPREMTSVRGDGLDLTWMSRGRLPSIEQVLSASALEFYARGGHVQRSIGHYATSWALVHLLALGADDLRPRFREFLGALSTGDADPAELFAEHFQGAELQARLDDYVARGRFRYYRMAAGAPRRNPPRARPMSDGESHLHWAWLWGTTGTPEAWPRVRAHLEAAGAETTVRAQSHLLRAGFLENAEDRDAAERAVTAGLREFPDDPGLLHAAVELLVARGADPSIPGARLRKVARTAEQICAVAAVELVAGASKLALAHATSTLSSRPNSRLCRQVEARALAVLEE